MLRMTKNSIPRYEEAYGIVLESLKQGIKIADTTSMEQKTKEELKEVESLVAIEYGINNVNSSIQVKNYFTQVITDEEMAMCTTGSKVSFDKNSLDYLASRGYKAASMIRECRVLKGKISTLQKFEKLKDKKGFVRPTGKVNKTNRLNYSDPPLMSINKDMLWDIVLPRDENSKLFSVDIINEEPTILVNMLGIKDLREVLERGEDLYEAIYTKVFDKECGEKERKELKRAWNSMSYGARERTVSKATHTIDGEMLFDFFSGIEEYKKYKRECKRKARAKVQKQETYFGTEVCAEASGNRLARVLMDIPIQGTGSDILALLIEKFYEDVHRYGLDGQMEIYFTRYDEIVVQVKKNLCDKLDVCNMLKHMFEFQIEGWTPFGLKVKEIGVA